MTPPARLMLALKLTPNTVTWLGTIITVAVAMVFIPRGMLWQGALLVAVFMFSDGIDGQMARLTGRSSSFGAFLDSSLDRIGDGAVFGAVVLYYAAGGDSVVWTAIALGALLMGQVTSYVKARGESLGFSVVGGLAARADRLMILLFGVFLTGLGISWVLPVALCWLFVASSITVAQRMLQVYRQAEIADASTRQAALPQPHDGS